MKILAIIAEYNPFHNGHAYQLEQAKKITGADYVIALMSGNFLQRGTAAMWDKYTRARMCAMSGVDLVLELPFAYATGSAFDFSNGAVGILNRLSSVDYLCFGSETQDCSAYDRISDILVSEPSGYSLRLRELLGCGLPYPAAREQALSDFVNISAGELHAVMSSPNSILALEYICALKRSNSSIQPIIVSRRQAGYHDARLHGDISSATAIRAALTEGYDKDCHTAVKRIEGELPKAVCNIIEHALGKTSPVLTEDLTPFLQSKLLDGGPYEDFCDISPALANSFKKLPADISLAEVMERTKTKNITAARINRGLLHLLLGYRETDRQCFIGQGYGLYANILAFCSNSTGVLKYIRSRSQLPLITKKADFAEYVRDYENIDNETANRMWALDMRATTLYNCLVYNRYGQRCKDDFTTQIPII